MYTLQTGSAIEDRNMETYLKKKSVESVLESILNEILSDHEPAELTVPPATTQAGFREDG